MFSKGSCSPKVLLRLAALPAVLLLGACAQEATPEETGTLSGRATLSQSLTLAADAIAVRVETLHGELIRDERYPLDGAEREGVVFNLSLLPGDYLLTAVALENDEPVAMGQGEIRVEAGRTSSLQLLLNSGVESPRGRASVDAAFNARPEILSLAIVPGRIQPGERFIVRADIFDERPEDLLVTLTLSDEAPIDMPELGAGRYEIELVGPEVIGDHEVLLIANDGELESSASYSVSVRAAGPGEEGPGESERDPAIEAAVAELAPDAPEPEIGAAEALEAIQPPAVGEVLRVAPEAMELIEALPAGASLLSPHFVSQHPTLDTLAQTIVRNLPSVDDPVAVCRDIAIARQPGDEGCLSVRARQIDGGSYQRRGEDFDFVGLSQLDHELLDESLFCRPGIYDLRLRINGDHGQTSTCTSEVTYCDDHDEGCRDRADDPDDPDSEDPVDDSCAHVKCQWVGHDIAIVEPSTFTVHVDNDNTHASNGAGPSHTIEQKSDWVTKTCFYGSERYGGNTQAGSLGMELNVLCYGAEGQKCSAPKECKSEVDVHGSYSSEVEILTHISTGLFGWCINGNDANAWVFDEARLDVKGGAIFGKGVDLSNGTNNQHTTSFEVTAGLELDNDGLAGSVAAGFGYSVTSTNDYGPDDDVLRARASSGPRDVPVPVLLQNRGRAGINNYARAWAWAQVKTGGYTLAFAGHSNCPHAGDVYGGQTLGISTSSAYQSDVDAANLFLTTRGYVGTYFP